MHHKRTTTKTPHQTQSQIHQTQSCTHLDGLIERGTGEGVGVTRVDLHHHHVVSVALKHLRLSNNGRDGGEHDVYVIIRYVQR